MSSYRPNKYSVERFFLKGELVTAAATRVLGRLMVEAVENEARQAFHMRTDTLLMSFRPIVKKDPGTGTVIVGVGSTARHAEYLNEGTSPHIISALSSGPSRTAGGQFRTRGKRLRSYPDNPDPLQNPQTVVRHPGSVLGQGFIEKGVDKAMDAFPTVVKGR